MTESDGSLQGTAVLWSLCATQFLLVAAVTVSVVALPSIRDSFAVADSSLQWIVSAYSTTFGCLLLVGGSVADRLGRRRVFSVGLAVFALASVLCAVADDFSHLIAARALQGVGAALVTPSALGLLTSVFHEDRARKRAIGAWSMVGAAGAVMGNVLGGLLTEMIGWRAVYFVNVPLCVLTLGVVLWLVPGRGGTGKGAIDVPGALLVTCSLGSLLIAIGLVPDHTANGPLVSGLAILGALSGGLFLILQHRLDVALLPLRALRNRAALAFVMMLMCGLTMGPFLALTVYLQDVLHYTPLIAGLAISPWAVTVALFARLIARLRHPPQIRSVIALGFLSLALGMGWLVLFMAPRFSVFVGVLPAQLFLGVGSAFITFGASMMALSALPRQEQSLAAGLLGSSQQLGQALTVSIFTALAFLHGRQPPEGSRVLTSDGLVEGSIYALQYCCLAALCAAMLSRLLLPRHPAVAVD